MKAHDTAKRARSNKSDMSQLSDLDTAKGANARLNITMTIESKSRKKTVYRVAQRPDGVIVEKPRYRPSPSTSNTRDKAEDVRSVGEKEAVYDKHGSDSYGGVFERGRNGYNDVFKMQAHVQKSDAVDPMQRFLAESGPWNTFNTRSVGFGNF
jgi:hypothetical protein